MRFKCRQELGRYWDVYTPWPTLRWWLLDTHSTRWSCVRMLTLSELLNGGLRDVIKVQRQELRAMMYARCAIYFALGNLVLQIVLFVLRWS